VTSKGYCNSGLAQCEHCIHVMPTSDTTDNIDYSNSVDIEDLVQTRSEAVAMKDRVNTVLAASSRFQLPHLLSVSSFVLAVDLTPGPTRFS